MADEMDATRKAMDARPSADTEEAGVLLVRIRRLDAKVLIGLSLAGVLFLGAIAWGTWTGAEYLRKIVVIKEAGR